MSAMTLYQIQDNLIALFDTLEGLPEDDAMRPELEEAIEHAVAAELKKVDGICHTLAHFESQVELAAAEIKRIQARKKWFENTQERLESSVRQAMELIGKRKLEGGSNTLQLRASPASVLILNADLVPQEYKRTTIEIAIDKAAVKKALQAGSVVPGADLSEGNLYLVRK